MKKIAIYGIGIETEKVLPDLLLKYDVIGVLDGFKTDGEIYGQSIITINKAIGEGVELIIVVARPGSCKAIAKRIGDICRENNIELFDIRGKNLLKVNRVVYDLSNVDGYTYADLKKSVAEFNEISFDLFDTLIMRTTYSTLDVFDLVKLKIEEKGIVINDFVNRRIATEKQLSRNGAPTLSAIYNEILGDDSDVSAETLANLEYEIDKQLLVPRQDMIDFLLSIKGQNRRVYITSDTYYSKEQISDILSSFGITGYESILASCEFGTSKTQNLFDKLKNIAVSSKIMHIGDDLVADVYNAETHGIKAFQIYSGSDLFDMVGGLGCSNYSDSLSDRIKIGMFVANLFNSPFQFENKDNRLSVNDAKNIGYLFCAPILNDFVDWFGKKIQSDQLKNICFCARDGYLIKKIFSKMYPTIKSNYFLTSRTSAIRAGVESKADIVYVDRMKFSGKIEDNLFRRFGLVAKDIPVMEMDESATGLMKYKSAILKAASIKRVNNRRYIDKLKLDDGNAVFFDFVAKGTSQMYVEKIMNKRLKGLYFLQLEPDYMKDKNLDIEPFYTENERDSSAIFEDYYILETLLTSPEPSVDEFDKNGMPVYTVETRSQKDIDCIMRAQDGILEYTDRYLRICPSSERKVNKKLDEVLLSLLHNIQIYDQDFVKLKVEDPFFNRMTDITDVL